MIFLIPVSILAFALNAALTKYFQIKYPDKRAGLRLFQAVFCLVGAAAFASYFFVQNGFSGFSISSSELIYGAVFGAFFFAACFSISAAYELGSMSLTSIMSNMSLFIPVVYSCVILGERMELLQIVGIVLIVVTMTLAVNPDSKGGGKSVDKKASIKWFCVTLAAMLSNGLTAVTQKKYATDFGENKLMVFMAIAYLFAAVLFFVTAFVEKRRTKEKLTDKALQTVALAIPAGLGSFGGNALLGILSLYITGAVLYPSVNGGLCIASALISFVAFKEKPTMRKLAAIFIGIVAIVLLSL